MENAKKLKAQLTREGFVMTPDGPVSVWREYVWNTGKVSTLDLRPGETFSPDEIIIRKFDPRNCSALPNTETTLNDP